MPMDPVTTNSTPVNGPVTVVPTPQPAPGVIPPAVGASGPPAVAVVPAVTPAVTVPVVPPTPAAPVESPELTQIRADRARLEAEVARLTPYAALGYRASQAQQTAPATPATPAPAPPKVNAFGIPEIDPNLESWVQTDANGNTVEIPGAPPGAASQVIAYRRAMANAIKKLATDPEGALGPILAKFEAAATEKAQKAFTEQQTQARNTAVAAQIMQANAEWMFAKDAQGQEVVIADPLTGQRYRKRTEVGDKWAEAAQHMMNQGMTDPVIIDDMAKSYAHRWAWTQAQTQQTAPAAPVAGAVVPVGAAPQGAQPQPTVDLKTAFLNRVAGALPGTVVPPTTSATPSTHKLSIREAMLQDLLAAGYTPGSRLPMAHQQAG